APRLSQPAPARPLARGVAAPRPYGGGRPRGPARDAAGGTARAAPAAATRRGGRSRAASGGGGGRGPGRDGGLKPPPLREPAHRYQHQQPDADPPDLPGAAHDAAREPRTRPELH